ncbi:MAG: SRPBCC family protein [Bacteroidota bacterium]
MNIIIVILLSIAGLIALLLIIALFTKKEYSLYREISINRTPQEVFNYIKLLKNQDHYSKWVMTDPAMKKEFRDADGTVGFIYAWNGNNKAGAGEQEIKAIKDNERIDMEIRFVRPFKGISDTYMTTDAESNPDKTKVKWSFAGKMKYPSNIMLLFMNMDKILGKDIEISLGNLKAILEK